MFWPLALIIVPVAVWGVFMVDSRYSWPAILLALHVVLAVALALSVRRKLIRRPFRSQLERDLGCSLLACVLYVFIIWIRGGWTGAAIGFPSGAVLSVPLAWLSIGRLKCDLRDAAIVPFRPQLIPNLAFFLTVTCMALLWWLRQGDDTPNQILLDCLLSAAVANVLVSGTVALWYMKCLENRLGEQLMEAIRSPDSGVYRHGPLPRM